MFGEVGWENMFNLDCSNYRLWDFITLGVTDIDASWWVYDILFVEIIKW